MSETPRSPVEPPSPSPSPSPASPKLLRRGRLLRLFLWITEPTLIKGISIGVVLSLVVTVGSKLDAVWYVASGLLLICVAMIFGVIIGHYVFESRKKRLQKNALTLLSEAGAVLPQASEDVLALVRTQDPHHLHVLWARLHRIQPSVRELSGLFVAMIFRVMAMSTLIAVLGGAISFAVFLASYLQVERMGQQNELLTAQNAMIEAQMKGDERSRKVDLSLSIAAQRQAIVLGLIDAIDAEIALVKQGRGDADLGSAAKTRISAGMYRRIQRTLSQLDPYRTVDPVKMEVKEVLHSPEQELLLHYLEGSAIDLTPLSLRGAYLVEADLSELEFGEILLKDARLDRAMMVRTDLSDAHLEGSSLVGVDARHARFGSAHMAGVSLSGALLGNADLTGADLAKADLSLSSLRAAKLENADLSGASLGGVDLAEADMSGRMTLSGADLTGADLSAVDRAPKASTIQAAKNWQLAVYSDALAGELGLDATRHAANKKAVAELAEAMTTADKRAIVDALRASVAPVAKPAAE